MKRRVLVFLLALCLAVALVPVTAFAGAMFGGGAGTQGNPWLITSRDDLIALADRLNSDVTATNYNNFNGCYFKQTADIDLTGVAWEPIGYSGDTCFAGNYDGDGHIIANAKSTGKVDPDGYATAGIFGWVLFGSVQNLHVKAADFVATGENNYSFVGGITGVCYGASIKNCLVTDSKLESRQDNNNNCAGSIVGYSAGGTFNNCAAENNRVTSMAYGGGFVGEVDDDNDGITTPSAFANCYAADCTVTGVTPNKSGSSFIGGFAGQITNEKPTAENCFVYRVKLSTDGTFASNTSIGVFAGNLWGNPSAHYQSKIITINCFYGECGTTEKAGDAAQKTAKEFENGTVAKQLGGKFVQHGGSPSLSIEPADYSAVDAAIAKANALNKDDYKDFSGVEAAINAVDRSKKTLKEQAAVDAMAKAIEDAIAALEKKSVGTTVQLPQTGDDSNLALWMALLLVSGAAICTMMAGKKKNYEK